MPIAPVLQKFVDDELARAPALVERVLAGTLQLLRDGKESALAGGERGYQFPLVEALQGHGRGYEAAFTKALAVGVADALRDHTGTDLPDAPFGAGLELMDESQVEVDIEISRAMQLIDATAEWELRELQMFTSTLIGQKHVTAESNPFRPQVYAAALWAAACAASPLQAHRTILLRLSAGVAAGLLKNAWAAACTRLEAQGVQPGIYRTVLLPGGAGATRGPAPPDASRPGAIGSLLASMPAGRGPAPGAAGGTHAGFIASPEFEQALVRLDELLRQLPRQATARDLATMSGLGAQRAALVALAPAPQARQVIELMARVFDTMLSDPHLSAPFANVLARLQSSALRVALHEPEMFDSTRHAAWQLFDRIGAVAVAYPQANDPRAAVMLKACRTLADRLAESGKAETGVYRRALTQLDNFLTQQFDAQREAAQPAVDSLERAERRELLEQRLRQRLVDQMVNVRTTPVARRFVTSTWARVLAEAMLVHGEQGEPTRRYIKLVDELLWSLQLPDHPQSRQRLLNLLPSILQRLRDGMASIALPAAEQQTVLDELMTIHTEALRPGGRSEGAALTPEQIVQRLREEEVLPATTGQGGFSDSVIDLASMETVPAALMPGDSGLGAEDPAERVEALRPGQRLRLFLHGRWARVQLLWRSDQGSFMLFAGETAGRTHSITHRALERLAAAGLMQDFEPRPLVQRSLDAVMRDLARPG